LLALTEFTTTAEVGAEAVDDAVDDEHLVLAGRKERGKGI
jgi:hypothetical protein